MTGQMSDQAVLSLLNDAFDCNMSSIPQTETTTITFAGPVSDTNLLEALGGTIDIFNVGKTVAGASSVSSSLPGPGILQTALLMIGYGVDIIAEPDCFTTIGNTLSPQPAAAQVAPISPDVFTAADLQAATTQLGLAAGQSMQKAVLSWGWPMQYAAWFLANSYSIDFIVRNRYHMISEPLRDVVHFSSGETSGEGTSQVSVADFASRVNAYYRDTCCAPNNGIFLPITHRRQGAFGTAVAPTGEPSAFRPTNDYGTVDARQGGLALQNRFGNGFRRKLPLPYFIAANSPIVFQLNQQDEYLAGQMRNQLSITNGIGGAGPARVSPDVNILPTFGFAAPEVTIDATPVVTPSSIQAGTDEYKGGALILSTSIYGFELTDDLACAIQSPALKQALANEFGLQFASM
jgi:hypothetical protein